MGDGQLGKRKYDSSKSKVGRPRKEKDIRKLVIEMALANVGWGYTFFRLLTYCPDAISTVPCPSDPELAFTVICPAAVLD
jgi:hypothetical protein